MIGMHKKLIIVLVLTLAHTLFAFHPSGTNDTSQTSSDDSVSDVSIIERTV